MPTIADIPNEILDDILSYIPATYSKSGGLHCCCLTSKKFYPVASRLIYKHVYIKFYGADGFKDCTVRSLFDKNHPSHKYIQEISLVNAARFRRYLDVKGPRCIEAAQQLVSFLEHLYHDLSHTIIINCNLWELLTFIPPAYHSNIKSIGPIEPGVLEKEPLYPNLEALTLSGLPNPHRFYEVWKLAPQYQRHLKSLTLSARGSPRKDGHWLLYEGLYFEALTHLRLIGYKADFESAHRYIGCNKIKRLEILNSTVSLIETQEAQFCSLTDLTIFLGSLTSRTRTVLQSINSLLLKLRGSLTSLRLIIKGCNRFQPEVISDPFNTQTSYPSKQAFQRHAETLKQLWLTFTDVYSSTEVALPNYLRYRLPLDANKCSHYCSEGRTKTVRIPGRSDSVALDLETLSRFPKLEHLVVPIEAPSTWNSWVPSFSNLRSLYLINSAELYCSGQLPASNSFREDWMNWFLSPYRQGHGSRDLKLQVIAFRRPAALWNPRAVPSPIPGSQGYTAHFRDPDRPGYFSRRANTSEEVRQHYPETWDFFKGYFVEENPDYVWPQEDSNIAKGIFEDQDELVNVQNRSSWDIPHNPFICTCLLLRREQSLDAGGGIERDLN